MRLLLYIPEIIALLMAMSPEQVFKTEEDMYVHYDLPGGYMEVFESPKSDSVMIIETVCAPACSSTVRVYNKVSNALIRTIKPACESIFPYAWVENGELKWRDNSFEILDDEELKLLQTTNALP